MPVEGAVPSVGGGVVPLIHLLSPTVEDDGSELHQTLPTFLWLVCVVDVVAIGGEGIGHVEFALAYRDTDRTEVIPVFLGVGDSVVALGEYGVAYDLI